MSARTEPRGRIPSKDEGGKNTFLLIKRTLDGAPKKGNDDYARLLSDRMLEEIIDNLRKAGALDGEKNLSMCMSSAFRLADNCPLDSFQGRLIFNLLIFLNRMKSNEPPSSTKPPFRQDEFDPKYASAANIPTFVISPFHPALWTSSSSVP